MHKTYYCIGCGLQKFKPFMHALLGEIGLCKDCFEEVSMSKDMTFSGKEYIDFVISPFLYKGIIVEILHAFKFDGQKRYGDFLTALSEIYLKNRDILDGYDIIVPVPLHKNRLEDRTFNQSEIIANRLGRILDREINTTSLIRVKDTLHQSSLKGIDRILNVKDAFSVADDALKGRSVILVDDIYTMGETANECAKTLRLTGVDKVAVFALSKTVMKEKSSLI